MKKRWSFLLGASVLTGLASTLLFKQGKKQLERTYSTSDLIKRFRGKWWFVDQRKATQHQLVIDNQLKLSIDGKELEFSLIEWTAERLVVQDTFGFHLIVETKNQVPYTLYDEADDTTYVLETVVSVDELLKEEE